MENHEGDQTVTAKTRKKKSSSKVPTDENELKAATENGDDLAQTTLNPDQEVPVKPKKKRAPKGDESVPSEEPIKKKKSKAPKPPPADDEFQVVDSIPPPSEELEASVEVKPREKKSRKSKASIAEPTDSFEVLQVTNLDDMNSVNPEAYDNPTDVVSEPHADNHISEYQQKITDAYNSLASKVNFTQYVGDDDWKVIHLPKTARTEPKSGIRKILPGNSKDKKPGSPRTSIFKRFTSGVNSLVRDQNNLLFGERNERIIAPYEDDDAVDTDDLHRYAQRLRELEDQDREVNPEFLVLRDGKTVFGIHEADADGKIKLATRKPIYDRAADQNPDDLPEKKKLLSRLKNPFSRSKDKDDKNSKSENTTPNTSSNRKSSRKSLNDDVAIEQKNSPVLI